MLTGLLHLVLDVVDNVEEDALLVRDVLVTDAINLVVNADVVVEVVDVHSVKHILYY
jgi:hypothetical protein